MMVSPIVGRWPVVLRLSPGTRERQEEKDREREVGHRGLCAPPPSGEGEREHLLSQVLSLPWGPLSREREHLR